jgi:plastocyanin domain-containing protein
MTTRAASLVAFGPRRAKLPLYTSNPETQTNGEKAMSIALSMFGRSIVRAGIISLALGLAPTVVTAAPKGETTIEMAVTEKGFEPATVKVKKGEPVTLVITRKTDATCAKEIVIDEHKVHTKLPLNKAVKVTFTPSKSGELKYGCAMGKMIGGVLSVE